MAEKINWQEHNSAHKKKSRFANLGGWLSHGSKIAFSLAFVCIAFYYLLLPQLRVNYSYANTTCVILGKKAEPLSKNSQYPGYQLKFLTLFQVNNKTYTSWTYDILNTIYTNPEAYKAVLNEIQIGKYYTCWYDPADPHKVVLKRGWDHISTIFFAITLIVALASFTAFYRWYHKRNAGLPEQTANNKENTGIN